MKYRGGSKNYVEIHYKIVVFEGLNAANQYIEMNPSFAHE